MEIPITGMHCVGCAQNIEKHLKKIGLKDAVVDFPRATAHFTLRQEELLPRIEDEIRKLGYGVADISTDQRRQGAAHSLRNKFLFSLLWTVPLFAHMFLPFHFLSDPYLQLALCFPVLVLGLSHFGKSAWGALRRGYSNMDVLITISISAAFIYSLSGTLLGLGPDFLFYETSATIVTIVLLGNLLEEISVKKTSSAIEELSKIQPGRAKRIRSAEQETVEEVPSARVMVGDQILVNSGDRIPVDGQVYWGRAHVDQAMITGESLPVEKGPGQEVIGGTLVVQGTLKLKATAVREDTVLANMIRLVKEAQSHKPRIQRLGDKVSAVFVPAVAVFAVSTFSLSLLVFGLSFQSALLNSLAVLVIACPCAMGLATPTAIMAGIGQAARHGILIKGGDTLERFAEVKTVIFDKTGTLTSGKFRIKSWQVLGRDESYIKSILLGLERHSSHPIARSLIQEFTGVEAKEFESVEEQKGLGLRGRDSAGSVFEVGSYNLIAHLGLERGHDLYLLENGKLVATIDLQDEVKEAAVKVIKTLISRSIEPVMLSGDYEARCREVADRLGIKRFYSEQLPEAKLRIIEEIEEGGGNRICRRRHQ